MMAWVQPKESLVAWLNVLNGTFGIGTLLAPAAVAALATLSGSHDIGVKQALVLMPLAFGVGVAGAEARYSIL